MLSDSLPTPKCEVVVGAFLLLYALHYWKHIACRRSCESDTLLDGKTIIITGGNSGIGKVTALILARRGARVILACRNLRKAEEAAKEIKTRTGNSEVVVRHLDLSSLQSVREFANRINESEERLDILINNAGIAIIPGSAVTKDNVTLMFGVNHLGHFLLTNLLLDLIKKSAPSRVITVSSNAHESVWSQLDFTRKTDPLHQNHHQVLYPNLNGYHHSKLANILFGRELARRLQSSGVTSVSLHPGIICTPIWKKILADFPALSPLYNLLRPFIWLLCLDEEDGAQTTLHCALDESIPQLSGRYFTNCAVTEPSTMAQDDEMAKRLWQVSCEETGLVLGS